ncbi:unnamed protein product [Rhizoctonia solani]|uniref:Uncharacterized protein n=1 Tax=Rhizoctonia solani TaxID=456999 RepID=A0A8H2W8S4_9AGAM|nr:unnamed protein product [Rhizoctonia solani]
MANTQPGGAIVAANAGRFTDEIYTVSIQYPDNSTSSQEFERDHVLLVIEDAVNAGVGKVAGLKKFHENDGILEPGIGHYPHEFRNDEKFEFKLYRLTDGPLYEYPIKRISGTRSYFGPSEGTLPMETGAYRVVYTLNAQGNMGYLQGLIGHKDSSSFVMCSQFHARWDGTRILSKTGEYTKPGLSFSKAANWE